MDTDDPIPDDVKQREHVWIANVLRSLDPTTRRRFIKRLAGAGASMVFASSALGKGAFAQTTEAEKNPAPANDLSRIRVQAHRLSPVFVHEGVPRAMDHHSSGCLPVEKFPTFASGRQGRGPVRLLGFHHQFHLTRQHDVAQEESPTYGDGSAR